MRSFHARLVLVLAGALVALPALAAPAFAAPRILFVKNTGPIAYELKSLQTTRFYTAVDTPNVYAVLKVKTAAGDVVIYKGAIADANKNFYFPLWNGMGPDGKRLPTATYDYSLSVTKAGQTATTGGKIIVSRICFSRTNTWESWAQEENYEYGYGIAGSANLYVQATTAFAANSLTMWVSREFEGGGYEQRLVNAAPFNNRTRLNKTIYVRDGAAVPTRGMLDFAVWGDQDLWYTFTWIQ